MVLVDYTPFYKNIFYKIIETEILKEYFWN